MSLFNFISEQDKQDLVMQQQQQIETIKKKLKANGLDDYAIERELEKIFSKPDTMQDFVSGDDNSIKDVTFYFNEEEYSKFSKIFKVLNYVENNTNQNWILIGLIKLVEDGKIIIDEKKKEVIYNG